MCSYIISALLSISIANGTSVGHSVRKCIVAKRPIGSGCRLGWWVGCTQALMY